MAYVKKVFSCQRCGTDHWLYFREQEMTLRDEIKALENELLSKQDKNNLNPETKEKNY